MMVSLRHRLVLFAMPKCASTALEGALSDDMDVVISRHPGAKHTTVRKYQRHLKRYFESFTDGPLETVCLFREPTDWLGSWWRYRSRAELEGQARSTRGLSFDAFVRAYLDDRRVPADLGQQSRFVAGGDDAIGIDHLFRYDNVEGMTAFLADRLQRDIVLDRANVSPGAQAAADLAQETEAALRSHCAEDFRIYETIAR